MKPSRRSRRSAGASLLASAALLAFLGWRTLAIAPRLPGLFHFGGIRNGLSWSFERRVQRAIAQAPMTRKTSPVETTAVLAMVKEHVELHAVVMAQLEHGSAGRQLCTLVAMLAFPRFVTPLPLTEKEQRRCRELAAGHGLYALVRADAGQSAWQSSATRIARTEKHELWRLEDRDR